MTTYGVGMVSRRAGEPAQLEEIILQEPGPGEVLVRLLASGICHTDLHYKLGNIGNDFPYLLGHEGSGIVEQVGEGVTDPRNSDGNPNSPQVVVFLATIVDVTVGS